MAQAHDNDDSPRKKKAGGPLFKVMMGLAVISFVGFGFNMSGGGITKIGSVGNVDISVDDYARALRSEMASAGRQFGITLTMEQLLAFGMDAAVRQKMVSSAAIDSETNRLGLSVGDKRVALELAATNVFQGINGKFDRDIYRDTLKRNNLTEIEYEMGLRNDLSQALFEGVTVSNFGAPKVIAQKLYAYAAQTRVSHRSAASACASNRSRSFSLLQQKYRAVYRSRG
jgi:peptidyl-prolyl cis-trans isomerase D